MEINETKIRADESADPQAKLCTQENWDSFYLFDVGGGAFSLGRDLLTKRQFGSQPKG